MTMLNDRAHDIETLLQDIWL